MVRRLLEPDRAAGQRRFTSQAFRYDRYRSSDLAYSITGHSAQGATVVSGGVGKIVAADRPIFE